MALPPSVWERPLVALWPSCSRTANGTVRVLIHPHLIICDMIMLTIIDKKIRIAGLVIVSSVVTETSVGNATT